MRAPILLGLTVLATWPDAGCDDPFSPRDPPPRRTPAADAGAPSPDAECRLPDPRTDPYFSASRDPKVWQNRRLCLLGQGADDPVVSACRVDADCALGCVADGWCCAGSDIVFSCRCHRAYRADFLRRLRAHVESRCGGASCPDERCFEVYWKPTARCVAGRCTLVKEYYGGDPGATRGELSDADRSAWLAQVRPRWLSCVKGLPRGMRIPIRLAVDGRTGVLDLRSARLRDERRRDCLAAAAAAVRVPTLRIRQQGLEVELEVP